jgi:tetratricopeptide (TPR) repeat protein
LVTADGKALALAQDDASGRHLATYGVEANYILSLSQSSADLLNPLYTKIGIRKAWPEKAKDANVMLFLLAGQQDVKTYMGTLDDYIATFPQEAEGYLRRATQEAMNRKQLFPQNPQEGLDKAKDDLKNGIKYSADKSDAYYRQGQLILNVALSDSSLTDADWQLKAALEAVQQGIHVSDKPIYHLLEGNIYTAMADYQQAYNAYMKVNASSKDASPESYFLAAQALEQVPGAQVTSMIALLDSAVVKSGNPTPPSAATFVLERINLETKMSMNKEAAADYDLYYKLVDGQVNDRFYYFREQARSLSGDLDGALADIRQAIQLNSKSADYYAEEASLYVRSKDYASALIDVELALAIEPDFAACYRIRGVCYQRQGKQAEACEALSKAKALGDPLASRLLKQNNCK